MPTLTPSLTDACIEHILRAQLQTPQARAAWLSPMLGNQPIYDNIDLTGAARPFAASVVRLLSRDQLILALRGLRLGDVDATEALVQQIEQHALNPGLDDAPNPLLLAYRQRIVASYRDKQLDKRFVRLSLLKQQPPDAIERYIETDYEFDDLLELLHQANEPAFVLLGAPGAGKTTLLRQLQFDHAQDQINTNGGQIAFLAPLNGYRTTENDPRAWLNKRWHELHSSLPPLDELLDNGRCLLLLDALNEMPRRNRDEFEARVQAWDDFLLVAASLGNRVVLTCRSLDYSVLVTLNNQMPVAQVSVKPMDGARIEEFLREYVPDKATRAYAQITASPRLLELYGNPYFLSLLVPRLREGGELPQGRADLFTGLVREALLREVKNAHPALALPELFTEADRLLIGQRSRWASYALPDRGKLIPKLSQLAFEMQQRERNADGAQVRVLHETACSLLDHPAAVEIIKLGASLNVLDTERYFGEVQFFHQLLQEYFAARHLVNLSPTIAAQLARSPWQANQVPEPLAQTLARLPDSAPLPPLDSTGWEETLVLASTLSQNPDAFVRALLDANLALAGTCAAAPDARVTKALQDELGWELVHRSQDPSSDLRARIAAAEALGHLGDPRLERRRTKEGAYAVLVPPLVKIAAATYTIGDDEGQYADEKPARAVFVDAFEIGMFPVTHAEYGLFMQAQGYDDEQWWDTDAAKAWLRGQSSTEGQKQTVREQIAHMKSLSDEQLKLQYALTGEEVENAKEVMALSAEGLENWLEETYPSGRKYREPDYWQNPNFNNPAQPVVGICWHEARAYCNWLSAQTGQHFRLPTEAEWEAATRGSSKREYAYASGFDSYKCNTFESHIRKTTPVGVYPDGATPEGVHDLTGNVWEWTSSAYLPYPYKVTPEREDATIEAERRVLRGGSWHDNLNIARAAYRHDFHPTGRSLNIGFRVVVVSALLE